MAVAMLSKHEKIKLPTLGPDLSEAEAREIYRRGEEATVFALLELAQHWGASEQPTPATPSAMIPTFQKPAAKRGKRPGRKPGHAGAACAERPQPTVFKEHRANACPDCGGSLTRCRQNADPTNGRHSRGHSCRNHAAHDPSRLVPDLSPACGSGRARRAAGQRGRQSHVGAFGLVALWIGAHDAADCGGVELSPGIGAVAWRPDEDVAAAERDSASLIRTNSRAGVAVGRVARRRNWLARKRQDTLAVGLRHRRRDLLHDRSQPQRRGFEEVLLRGIRRHVGDRFLGTVQRGGLLSAAGVSGPPAARFETRRTIQQNCGLGNSHFEICNRFLLHVLRASVVKKFGHSLLGLSAQTRGEAQRFTPPRPGHRPA